MIQQDVTSSKAIENEWSASSSVERLSAMGTLERSPRLYWPFRFALATVLIGSWLAVKQSSQ